MLDLDDPEQNLTEVQLVKHEWDRLLAEGVKETWVKKLINWSWRGSSRSRPNRLRKCIRSGFGVRWMPWIL